MNVSNLIGQNLNPQLKIKRYSFIGLPACAGVMAILEQNLPALSEVSELVDLDLPGHGETPAVAGRGPFRGLDESVESFIVDQDLEGIHIVGSSLGARIVLELACCGRMGTMIALAPSGLWRG